MALLHRATLHPTKLELLTAWLPGRPWYVGHADTDLELVASYRFDDPAGAVGIETMLVRAGDGPVYQVPLTYRAAPLDSDETWLVGTCDHSVLGQRWVYDGCGDPVYAQALADALLAGTGQAEQFFVVDDRLERREPTMSITNSSIPRTPVPGVGPIRRVVDEDPTLIVTDSVELAVVRLLGAGDAPAGITLAGTWSGQPTALPLAYARLR